MPQPTNKPCRCNRFRQACASAACDAVVVSRRTPRRQTPLSKLKLRRRPSRGAGFWNGTRGSRTANARSSRPVPRTCASDDCCARRPPPLFACRPPMRRDGEEYAGGFEEGDKVHKSVLVTHPHPQSLPTRGREAWPVVTDLSSETRDAVMRLPPPCGEGSRVGVFRHDPPCGCGTI